MPPKLDKHQSKSELFAPNYSREFSSFLAYWIVQKSDQIYRADLQFWKKIMKLFCCIQVVGFDYYCLIRLIANITLCCFHSLLVWLKHSKWEVGRRGKQKPRAIKNKQNIHNDLFKHIFKGSCSLMF